MEEVIRVREVRKSMEQSHFFTPACSPMVTNDFEAGGSSRPASKLRFPTSTPANHDLYMTLDISSAVEEESEPELVRKKSAGTKGAKAAPVLGRRPLKNTTKAHESTADSLDSSVASEHTATPDDDPKRRVVHRRMDYFF